MADSQPMADPPHGEDSETSTSDEQPLQDESECVIERRAPPLPLGPFHSFPRKHSEGPPRTEWACFQDEYASAVDQANCEHAGGQQLIPMIIASAGPFKVLLRRIPESICQNADYIDAMFEQIGVDEVLIGFTITILDDSSGDIEVSLKTIEAAHAVIRHFAFCHWGASDSRLQVFIVSTHAPVSSISACDDRLSKQLAEVAASPPPSSAPLTGAIWETEPESDKESGTTEAPSDGTATLSRQSSEAPRTHPKSKAEADGDFYSNRKKRLSLLVAYFPKSSSCLDLERIFTRFGKVSNTSIMRDRTGVSKCFGFVNYLDAGSALKAFRACEQGSVIMRDEAGKLWHVKAAWAERTASERKRWQELRPAPELSSEEFWPAPAPPPGLDVGEEPEEAPARPAREAPVKPAPSSGEREVPDCWEDADSSPEEDEASSEATEEDDEILEEDDESLRAEVERLRAELGMPQRGERLQT